MLSVPAGVFLLNFPDPLVPRFFTTFRAIKVRQSVNEKAGPVSA
jgi:hypothetical protein